MIKIKLIFVIVFLSMFIWSCSPTPVSSPGFYGFIRDIDSKIGSVNYYRNSYLVSIGAGYVKIGKVSYWHAWYIIDLETRTCWFKVGTTLNNIDCCKLRGVKNAEPHLKFLTPQQCGAATNP